MATPIENQKLLYHLTAVDNIESILRDGLQARANVQDFTDVAEQDIIDFRNQEGISDLIPFHFFLGTPFAGAVQVKHSTKEFVYITLHRDIAKENNFKIFPTHPKHMNTLKAYDYEEGMKEIDWELMNKRDYSDYECKEVCMAECVAPFKAILPNAFHSIIVKSEDTKKYIEELCKEIFEKECNFFIDVKPEWFIGT
jgi:hypothetical protein